MKKLLIPIFVLFLLVLTANVQATATAPTSSDNIAYYKLENLIDLTGNGNTLTLIDTPTADVTGILDNAYDFDGTNDGMITTDSISTELDSDFSICGWIYPETDTDVNKVFFGVNVDGATQFILFKVRTDHSNEFQLYMKDATNNAYLYSGTGNEVTLNAWNFICVTFDDSSDTITLYLNGSSVASGNTGSSVSLSLSGEKMYLGYGQANFKGKIDEFSVWSTILTSGNMEYLYNSGSPDAFQQYPFTLPPPTAYFDLTAKDNETSATITNFNATINNTFYSTTNGTINTDINQSKGYILNIEFGDIHNYFNKTYNSYNTSSDLQGVILEYPKITAYDNETSAVINNFNVSSSGYFAETTTGTIYFPYNTTKTITFRSSNYDNKIKTFDFSDSTELNQPLIYTLARMKIKGYESPLNTTLILNYSIIAESLNSSFTDTSSTTNGTLNIEYPRGETINITIDSSLYALKSDLFIPSYDMTYNISTYPTNSVYLSIYSGITLIDDRTINITLIGPEYKSVSTTNGTYKFNNILAGSYQVDLEASGFSDNTYYFSLSNRTHRELDYYMSSSCTDITFSLLDTYQAVLPNVVVTFNQQINGSWVDIGQRSTDISGDILICLEEEPHLIQAVKTGYQTWEGTLTPLTTEYTIFLDLIGARVYETLFDDLTFIFSPQTSTLTGNLTNFTMTTYSPEGKVLYFGLNSNYNGTSYISNITTSASGGIATITLPLNQDDDDNFKVRFFVKSTDGNYHEFTIDYNVFDYAISQYSLATIFADWKAQEGNFVVIFWVYVMMLAALGLLALSGANNIVLLIAAILFIGLFSSPLIAAFSLTIGIVQITLLVLVAVAMGKGGLI